MPGTRPLSLNPAALPLGTMIGPWRVVDFAGRGSHGAVYRAVHVDKELASFPATLKVRPRSPLLAVGAAALVLLTGLG